MDKRPSKALLKKLGLLEPNEELFWKLWITEIEFISDHLGLRKLQDKNGRFHLEIEIDSKTGIDELLRNWHKILDVRDKLVKIQGIDRGFYIQEIISLLTEGDYSRNIPIDNSNFWVKNVKSKPSYHDISMDLNFDALVFITSIVFRSKNVDFSENAEELFTNLLLHFGFNENEIPESLTFALDCVKNEKCPWDISNSPIDKFQVREKIRYLKNNPQISDETYQAHERKNILDFYAFFVRNGWWLKAAELLKHTYPITYQKYEPRFNARTTEVLLSTASFK